MKTKNIKSALIYALLVIACFITLYPFVWMLFSSFKPTGEIMTVPPKFLPDKPSMNNYITVLKGGIGHSFIVSLVVASIRTAATVYTSGLMGYIFAKFSFKCKNLIFTVIVATMMVPWIVTIIPLYNIFTKFGLYNRYPAIILTGVVSSYGIYLVRSFMYQIDSAFLDSARIDGCGEFKIFNKIILPLAKPSLAVLTIMTFLASWDDYLWPLLMMSSENKFTLTLTLSKFAFKHYTIDYGPVIAGSVISSIPVILVLILGQKHMVDGIALGGVKG
jgi:ABC-type glycerol-3-phosphate transport system permease component